MNCPFCHQQIKDDAKFCAKCGHKIPRCPTCGKVITVRTKFCSADGTPLPEDLIAGLPESGAAAAAGAGAGNTPPRTSFCKQCGKPCAPGQTLCPDCQKRVQKPPAKKKKSILPILLVILLLLILLGVGLAFAFDLIPLGGSGKAAEADSSEVLAPDEDEEEEEVSDSNGGGLTPTTDGETETEDDDQTGALAAADSSAAAESAAVTDEDAEHRYEIIMADVTWMEALELAEEAGGHLATITTVQEYEEICTLAAAEETAWLAENPSEESVTLYLWLGGNITSSSMDWGDDGTWITGEAWISDTDDWWYPGEPSKEDTDGTKEYYLCLWNAQNKGWTINDQRNNIVEAIPAYSGHVGYVVEYGDGYGA